MPHRLSKYALPRQAKFAHLLRRERQNAAMGTKQTTPRVVLAQNLKALMAHGDVNQTQLGKKAGIAQSTIGRILAEKHAPDIETLAAIGKALGVSPWQLLVPHLDPVNLPAIQSVTPAQLELVERLRAAADLLAPQKRQ
jgi:transcriptional regulator with XRE-family HTH domain